MNPLTVWPKIRRVKPGVLRVQGRCISTGQWLILRVVAFALVVVLTATLLAAACLPWVLSFDVHWWADDPLYRQPVGLLTGFRWWLRHTLTEDFPSAGNAMAYTGTNPYDWHLLGLCLVLYWLRRPLRYSVAACLAMVLEPFFGRRFKISISRDSVTVHRWLGFRSKTFKRHAAAGGAVAFRAAPPHHQTGLLRVLMRMKFVRPSQDDELVSVQAMVGLRPVTITTPRKLLDAEKIVQSLSLALRASRDSLEN